MKLLLVENDSAVTFLWFNWFSRDHNVFIADTVEKAINQINTDAPDIVLLDLRLNGPEERDSGLAVYQYIRQTNLKLPVIFITGLEYNVNLFTKAQQYTVTDQKEGLRTILLRKPLKIRELTNIVNAMAA